MNPPELKSYEKSSGVDQDMEEVLRGVIGGV